MAKVELLLGLYLLLSPSLGVSQSTSSFRGRGDIAVIVNPSNPINEVSLSDLRKMLTGDRRFWQGNVQVKLVLPAPGTWERSEILTTLLQVNNAEFNKGWMQRVFRGEASDLPPSMPSLAMAEQYLISTPGGIAFVLAKDSPFRLKVLRVDGKLPGDAGYALR